MHLSDGEVISTIALNVVITCPCINFLQNLAYLVEYFRLYVVLEICQVITQFLPRCDLSMRGEKELGFCQLGRISSLFPVSQV